MLGKGILQFFRLVAYCHNVTWSNGKEVVGIVQLILQFDGDNSESSLLQELNEGYLTLGERIVLLSPLAGVEVHGDPLGIALLGKVTAFDKCASG